MHRNIMKIQSSINFFHTDILEKFIDDDNSKKKHFFYIFRTLAVYIPQKLKCDQFESIQINRIDEIFSGREMANFIGITYLHGEPMLCIKNYVQVYCHLNQNLYSNVSNTVT